MHIYFYSPLGCFGREWTNGMPLLYMCIPPKALFFLFCKSYSNSSLIFLYFAIPSLFITTFKCQRGQLALPPSSSSSSSLNFIPTGKYTLLTILPFLQPPPPYTTTTLFSLFNSFFDDRKHKAPSRVPRLVYASRVFCRIRESKIFIFVQSVVFN